MFVKSRSDWYRTGAQHY